MIAWLRRKILYYSLPITNMLGKIHIPYGKRLLTETDFLSLRARIKKGDILLTFRRGELSNLFIPGEWSHVAVANSTTTVVEAIGRGVGEKTLRDFLLTKDRVIVVRPLFPATETSINTTINFCEEQVGKPYDSIFEESDAAFYCSELAYDGYRVGHPDMPFKVKEIWGVKTALPDDFLPGKHWGLIYKNLGDKH